MPRAPREGEEAGYVNLAIEEYWCEYKEGRGTPNGPFHGVYR